MFCFLCELLHQGTLVGATPSCHSEILETKQGLTMASRDGSALARQCNVSAFKAVK